MSAAITAGPPGRHPWIAQFLADPLAGYGDLVAGYAAIHPYERADAPDAARLLFGGLPEGDPVRDRLDAAVLAWLEAWRRDPVPAAAGPRQRWVRQLCETLEITYLLNLPRTAVALRRRRLMWEDFCSRHVLAPSRDAREMLWRAMALTQKLAHATDPAIPAQGLLPLWHTLCRESGEGGALPQRYLAVGLLGLRRLPKGEGDLPWLAGLAHWALAREPSTEAFRAEWLALKPLYPRNLEVWRDLVTRLLGTKEFRDAGIEPPGWWGTADRALAARPRAPNQRLPQELRSPGPDACAAVIARLGRPFGVTRADIDQLVDAHRRFRDATGDPQFFLKMVHALGSALVDLPADAPVERARLAEKLAREAVTWAPYDDYRWSLWHRALIAQGRLVAAELVGWERLRRTPDQADAYNQLALLLARLLQRQREADALLRETIERFSANVPARCQLAELLIARDRAAEAEAVIDAAFAANAINEVSFGIRARLQAHAGQRAAAATLAEGLRLYPQNAFLVSLEQRLARGETLPWVAANLLEPPAASVEADPADDADLAQAMAFGRLRRLRFRREYAAVLGDAPPADLGSAGGNEAAAGYAQLLALRDGGGAVDAMPVFAVAFEAALRAEDRARLDAIAQKQPRLRALILLARALFGDAAAAAQVDAWLAAPLPRYAAQVERGLHGALIATRGKVVSVAALIEHRRATVLRLVHDASEATLGDALLAA